MTVSRELGWWWSRLRAMSPAELAHRGLRVARYPIDQLRTWTGRYARPSPAMRVHLARWPGPPPSCTDLFAGSASAEVESEVEHICAGKRRVLGLGWIELPPDGWHYEPLARAFWPRVAASRVRRAAPAHFDPRLTWELNRGHEWVLLARSHATTREPRYLARLCDELVSWRLSNPLGVGINWASAMEAAIRIHSLVWCASYLRDRAGVLGLLAEAIYEHACVVSDHLSLASSANNHLLVELSALIVAALALRGELARMYAPALARLTAELDRQVFADGVSAEMATHYHVFVLEALLLVAHAQRARDMDSPRLAAVIGRMADYLGAVRCDDGSLLQQGDSDNGCILGLLRHRHADRVLAAARALGARSLERSPPRSRQFATSGQVVLRSKRLHATFDAGPFGFGRLAAHAHCDALAITLAIDGRRVIVDRGTFRYNGDPRARDRFRGTAAHNTAQLGALEQARAAGPFLWSRRPRVTLERCELTALGDIVQASHDGFVGWTHRRTLVHHRSVLALVDELHGPGHPQRVVGRLHFAPELSITAPCLRVAHGRSPLAWVITNAPHVHVTRTAHSDAYAASTPACTVELAGMTSGALITMIAPAHVPQDASIAALVRFAAGRGVQLPRGGLAPAK